MAAQSLSTFDASLKDFYEGKIRRVLNRQVRLWNYIKRGQKQFTGRQVLFPVNVQGSPAAAFMNAGGDLPTPVAQATVDVKIPIKQLWSRIQVTYDVIEAARDDRGAFERPVALEISRMTEDCIDKANRAAFGDGWGILGTIKSVSGASSPYTITMNYVTDSTNGKSINGYCGTRHLKNGDYVDVYDMTLTYGAVAAAAKVQSGVVSAVSTSANTFVLTGGTETAIPAAGYCILIAQPDLSTPLDAAAKTTKEPMGLGGIVDDATWVRELHNIDRNSYPIWNANKINVGTSQAAPGALTLDHIQRIIDMASEGGMGFPSIAMMHYSVRREVVKLMVTDRRYMEKYKYDPGIEEDHMDKWPWPTSLSIDGVPFVFEKHCPYQTIFTLDNRALRRWVLSDFTWINRGGNGQNIYLVPGKAGLFEAQAAMLYNLGTDEVSPATCGVLRFISSTIDRVAQA